MKVRKSFIESYNIFKEFCVSKEDRAELDKSHKDLMNSVDECDKKGEVYGFYELDE